ncbi:hypothetical protein MMC11_004223 [Xylographa trunciseda]|nr:hypothetical protein [Xylographa trunciseda]
MSTEVAVASKQPTEETILPQRKKIRTSDLPLNAAQRSSIDSLLHTIKKKGEFDSLRKRVWSQYAESDAKTAFTTSLTELAETEIDREPSLLSRDRGKAATLIEGAVDRSTIYKTVEANIDALIAEHISKVELAAREIRKLEVGEDGAAEEEKRGNKTEEEYAREVARKRDLRERTRRQEESKRRREEEKEKLREEERLKKLELDKLRSVDERRRQEEAKAEKRKLEREAERVAEQKAEEEREAERQERYERRRKEEEEQEKERIKERERLRSRSRDRDRDRDRDRERDRDRRRSRRSEIDEVPWGGDDSHLRRSPSRSRERETSVAHVPAVDERALEEAALELLLREGRELASKSAPRTEVERSESLEPPPRRGQAPKIKALDLATPKRKDDSHSPSKPEFKSSKLVVEAHYSSSKRGPRSRSSTPERPSKYGSVRYRSRSRSYSRPRHSERRVLDAEAKEAWKAQAVAKREREAEAYKRAAKEGRARSRSRSRSHSRSRSPGRTKERGSERERSHHYRKESEGGQGYSHRRHHSRSRSPTRDRRKYERSRSPRRSKGYHDGDKRMSGRKSPVEIDRYVPAGSIRDRERDGGRDRDRDGGERKHHREGREKDRERGRDEKGRYGEEKGRYGDEKGRYGEEKHRYVEIDRYVPGGGSGGGHGEEDGKKRRARDE